MRRAAGSPADIGRYLEHLVETEGRALASVRLRLAAIAAAHRLGGHEDPTTRPLVKATMKRLAREYGKPRKQAKGLTSEALAAVKANGADPAGRLGKRPCGRVDGPERACTGLEVGFSPHPSAPNPRGNARHFASVPKAWGSSRRRWLLPALH